MKQQEINYKAIIDLGFNVEECNDAVHESIYGYPWKIFTLELTKRIFIDWDQSTRTCQIIRADKKANIKARRPIYSEGHLKDIIKFFKDA